MPTLSGPCLIIRNGTGLVAKAGVTINRAPATWQASNTFAPNASTRRSKIMHTVTFETDGRLNAAQIAELYGNLTKTPGSLLFGNESVPLHIFEVNSGLWRTYKRTALTGMPGLFLGTSAQAVGAVTYTCIPDNTVAVTAANSLVTDPTEVDFPGWANTYDEEDDVFTPAIAYSMADAKSDSYTLNWKSAGVAVTGFSGFHGQAGVRLNLGMQVADVNDDARGISDSLLQSLSASASLIPIGPTAAQMMTGLNHQGAGAAIGGEITLDGYTLEIIGSRLKAVLKRAGLSEDSQYFGTDKIQQAEATWISGAGTAGGAYVAPVTLEIL